jgi:hypothetical protein
MSPEAVGGVTGTEGCGAGAVGAGGAGVGAGGKTLFPGLAQPART